MKHKILPRPVIITLCTVTVSAMFAQNNVYGFTLVKLKFYYKLFKMSHKSVLKGCGSLVIHVKIYML